MKPGLLRSPDSRRAGDAGRGRRVWPRCFPEYVFHWDEVQLTLGLERFDPRSHQPHPPGYYLFIVFGRLLRPFVVEPESALRAVAALAGGGLCGLAGLVVSARGNEACLPRLGLGRGGNVVRRLLAVRPVSLRGGAALHDRGRLLAGHPARGAAASRGVARCVLLALGIGSGRRPSADT